MEIPKLCASLDFRMVVACDSLIAAFEAPE